jgi:hypothetical protein
MLSSSAVLATVQMSRQEIYRTANWPEMLAEHRAVFFPTQISLEIYSVGPNNEQEEERPDFSAMFLIVDAIAMDPYGGNTSTSFIQK